MPNNVLKFVLFSLVLLLTACDGMSPSPQAAVPPSQYNVEGYFKDPEAQALARAAEHGDAQAVQRLMKQEHVNPDVIFSNEKFDSGMPLLAWPIFTRNPDGLRAMLDNGADPNARKPGRHVEKFEDGSVLDDYRYDNAMVWAARQEDPIYLKLLLDHGGDPNTRNTNGETLLFQAFIWHNQWQNVQLLIEQGANINAKSQGLPILFDYAARGGFMQVYWLLQHGADPKIDDWIKQPPPPEPPIYPTVESVFWHPGNPDDSTWQRKCQQWLLQHGYQRPPMPKNYRDMRKNLGFPYEEKDIPLL